MHLSYFLVLYVWTESANDGKERHVSLLVKETPKHTQNHATLSVSAHYNSIYVWLQFQNKRTNPDKE